AAHERGERTPVQEARRDLPAGLAGVIDRAIAADPERRHETGDALGAERAALLPRASIVRVVAVLPFKNLTAESERDHFVEGLAGEIIRDLAVVQGLAVVARASA